MSAVQPKSFEDILKDRSPLLAKHLAEIRARAEEDWIHFLGEDKGSHTGCVHLRNVERNANKIVPDSYKESFSDGEIFLLLASILLHDIGKIVPKDVPVDPLACPDARGKWGFRCPLKEWDHHCASKRLIDEQWAILGLPDARIAGYCGLLAYSHGAAEPLDKARTCLGNQNCVLENPRMDDYRNTSLEPYGDLRIPLLAAILRIADETENCWTRALRREAFEIYKKSGKNLSKAFRRNVEDVTFDHDGRCVIMHVPGWAEPNADDEFLMLESLAYTGKKAEKIVRAWSGALRPVDAVFSRILFEHGGRFYKDPLSGFRKPPPLTTVFHEKDSEIGKLHPELQEDEQFIRRCFGAITDTAKGSNWGQNICLSSLEASLDHPIESHQRWIIKLMGEVHPGLRVETDNESDGTRISIDLEALTQVEREIGIEKDEKPQQGATNKELYDAVLRLLNGTYGFQTFSWSAIEAEVGHCLKPEERGRLLDLSDRFPEVEIKPDQVVVDRLVVDYDSTRCSKALICKKRFYRLIKVICQTSRMNLMNELSWQEIENEFGSQLTSKDHAELVRVQNKFDIWQVSLSGLTEIKRELFYRFMKASLMGLTKDQRKEVENCWRLS